MSRPLGMQITQTVVTLPAATDTQLVAKNPYRHYLAIVTTGINPANIAFDAAAVASTGWPLAAAPTVGGQGGSIEFDVSVPLNSIHAYSTLGTTVVVLEGQ